MPDIQVRDSLAERLSRIIDPSLSLIQRHHELARRGLRRIRHGDVR
jgi:hypothetical protein